MPGMFFALGKVIVQYAIEKQRRKFALGWGLRARVFATEAGSWGKICGTKRGLAGVGDSALSAASAITDSKTRRALYAAGLFVAKRMPGMNGTTDEMIAAEDARKNTTNRQGIGSP